jgi:hypothetical protein
MPKCRRCKDTGETSEWHIPMEFNPGSALQKANLIKHYGLAMPHKRGEDRLTTESKYLKRFAKKFPVFDRIIECQQREKLISTYMWEGRPDGRISTIYGFAPSTWRKSSRQVNLQNIPKRSDLAHLFRKMLIAAPGHVLIEADSSAIEAVLVGFCAGDAEYIRLAQLGIHDFVTAKWLSLEVDAGWETESLRSVLKGMKRDHSDTREAAKRGVHACLPGDHEVLTESGWVRLDELSAGVPVAQWDKGKVSFVAPVRHSYNYQGSLISLHGRGLSIRMTHNHRVPVCRVGLHDLKVHPAESLPHTGRIPVCGVLDGPLGTAGWLQLDIAIAADASVTKFNQSGTAQVAFHLVRPRKIERLKWLLRVVGIKFSVKPCKCHPNGVKVRFTHPANSPWLERDLKTFRITPLLNLSLATKRIFLEELLHWDGTGRERKAGSQTKYMCINYKNVVTVQTIAHLTGQQSLVRGHPLNGYVKDTDRLIWDASYNNRKFSSIAENERWAETFTGTVYCLTVPSGFFMVRYQDRISVTGNSNYLLSPHGLNDEYPEYFPTQRKGREFQEFYFGLFPKLRSWHQSTLERVHRETYLENHYQYRHYFYSVFSFDKRRNDWILGDDAKRAVAFVPQSDASAIQTEDIILLDSMLEVAPYLRLIIHDSVVLEVPENELESVARRVHTVMTRPRAELAGLAIGAEVSWGPSLGEMSPLTFKEETKCNVPEQHVQLGVSL